MTAQLGDISTVRSEFVSSGSLSREDWDWQPESVVALSHDIGDVGSAHNVTFAVGFFREAAVNYMGTDRVNYWRSTTPDINSVCVHAFLDFPTAEAESRTMDAEIAARASSVAGTNYSDIVALSPRQVFGAMDITIPLDTLDTNDIMIFVKEVSSNGNVNTVDVILPISPDPLCHGSGVYSTALGTRDAVSGTCTKGIAVLF